MGNNQLTKANATLSPMQKYQVDLALKVEHGLEEVGQRFTDYGKQCVVNAIAAIITYTRNQMKDLKDINQTSLKIALTNIGLTELNFNAIPAEAFPDIRRGPDGKWSIALRPQGAGNEKLVRNFGLNVEELKQCILVREGDEYTLPGFDGEKMTPFKWTPKSLDKKVILVVYPVKKKDGSLEYLMASRDSIIPNIIAQIRNANLYREEFMEETYVTGKDGEKYKKREVNTDKRDAWYEKLDAAFEGKTLDEILELPEWKKELSNTYTSGGSRESMIIRKMQNNALKRYPREFNNTSVAEAVKDMFEDQDESLNEKPKSNYIDADPVATVEKEINEEVEEGAVEDFNVTEEGEVVEETSEEKTHEEEPKKEQPKPADPYEGMI